MSARDKYDAASGSGPEREPSEERGRAAWSDGETGAAPPWASAETQTGGTTPPPWASAETRTGGTPPPPWGTPPPGPRPTPPPTAGQAPPPGPAYPPPYTSPAAPPYTLSPTPPPPAPRRGAGRLLAVIVLVAVIGGGTGAGAWYLTRDHGTGGQAGPTAGASVRSSSPPTSPPPTTPSATASATTTATGSTLVAHSAAPGYETAQDPVGYAIDVPDGWTRREKQGKLAPVVFYDSPDDGRQLQIFEVTESTPYESLTLAETDPGFGFAKQPGYQVVERDHGDTWAELSYLYDDSDKGTRQVIDHRFEAADGTLYAIRSSGSADLDPEQVRDPLRMAVRYFCPSGAQCT
ncbi:hypothetical protein [Streptomyces cylindrosporus]|uniref:Serine/arginine repetitive matrix protein 2 n=1 Tax=Streptomyces cylindrosporus TaxID=2927583 RepID=A0ABS9YHI9_9ACTN|nr:hypothetical protein [Streptomyces cylindrosporus]MCI3276041.1 hypothetical protein [Streptomyces cylindrosporus]